MVLAIIDPTASARTAEAAREVESPRAASLTGLRIGLLGNTKRNAAEILDAVGAELAETYGVGELVPRTKREFAMPLPDDLLDDLVAHCDVVVVGVGDCGSCSAAAIADGIRLEAAGLPVAVVCTDVFDTTARAMAELQGDPGFAYLLTEHPIANLTAQQIAQRAVRIADDVADRLVGRRALAAS